MADSSFPFVLPQNLGSAYMIQRQQALANALSQNALQGQPQPQMVSSGGSENYHVMPKTSWAAPIGQIAQGALANALAQGAAQNQNQLGQQQMNWATGQGAGVGAMSNAMGNLNGDASSPLTTAPVDQPGAAGTAGDDIANGAGRLPSQLNQPQQQPGALAPGGQLNPAGWPISMAAMRFFSDPQGYWKDQAAALAPTDQIKNDRWMNISPQQAAQNYQNQQTKDSTLVGKWGYAMPNGRGGYQMTTVPDSIPGAQLVTPDNGRTWQYVPMSGGAQAIQQEAGAKAAGAAQFKPVQVFNPQTQQMEYSNEAAVTNPTAPAPIRNNNPGAMMPGGKLAQYPDMQSGLAALDGNLASYGKQGVNTVAGVISKWAPPNENDTQAYIKDVSQRLGIPANQKIDLSNPLQRQALSTAIALHENGPSGVFGAGQSSGRMAASAPLGVQTTADTGARNLQDELSKKWTTLSSANSEAQNTIGYLQNIKALAPRAALGQQADRLNFINGLLSLAGSDKATDAVTANTLLDKYSNQITARLSANGMGTDAARSILQAAYPNSHMNKDAIMEASDALIGAQQMTQAKARLLTPLANSRNATEYNNAELKFDQNADARLFQLQGMDPKQQAAFVSNLSPAVAAQLQQKRQALKAMGALQ